MIKDDDDVGELIEQVSKKQPDLVEFRFDNVQDFSIIEKVGHEKRLPAIATDKAEREASVIKKLLLTAATSDFEFVDVNSANEVAISLIEQLKSNGAQTVVSFHDSNRTPSLLEMSKILDFERQVGGDVCKIVTTAKHPEDNLTILRFVSERSRETRLVSFAMGSLGVPSRILSPLFGAQFTYAALDDQSETALGQITIDDLRTAWRILGIQ
mgnify:CR=1 FL=1